MKAAGLLLWAVLACGGGPAQEPENSLPEQILALVNVERHNAGLEGLQICEPLTALALDWARNIERSDWLQHRPDLSGIQQRSGYSYLNENIYSTSGKVVPARVVQAWMGSPGHRKNLLAPQSRVAGLAVSRRNNQGNLYVVFNSGTLDSGQPGQAMSGITVSPSPRPRSPR
jgi:uncharacterized protein YkwD